MSGQDVGGPLSHERWQLPRHGEDACALIVSRLDQAMVGIRASEVISIEYAGSEAGAPGAADGEQATAPLVDLCRLLGSSWPADGPARCSLLVWSGVDRLRLLAGRGARVVAVPNDQLRPLPRFLAGLRQRAAVSAMLLADRQLGLVIDNNLLGPFSQRPGTSQGAGQ